MRQIAPIALSLTLLLSFSLTQAEERNGSEDSATTGSSIMQEVFHRFHINYEMSRTHKVGYYQEALEDTSGVHYLVESIVDVYVPHNLSQQEHASVKPIRSRKLVFEEIDEEKLLFGSAADMARCSIWRPNSFLSEKNRDNYRFKYKGDSLFHRFQTFAIEFTPLNSKGNVSGHILIDKSNYAVLHIDYTPDTRGSKEWRSVTWTEEFYFVDGKYELSKVKFEGLGTKSNHEYSATLIMQHVRVLSEIPDSEHYLDKDDTLLDHAEDHSEEDFWAGYYTLKEDVDAEEVVHVASK